MPQNKVVYSKDLNYTYILTPDGKEQIGGMEGDQTKNPLVYNQDIKNSADLNQPFNAQTIPSKIEQMGKDYVVDAASTAPLQFIPGVNMVANTARIGGSLLSGLISDRVLNGGDKTMGDSVSDAAFNTGVSALIPFLMENKIKLNPNFKVGGGILTKLAAALTNPITSEPRMEIRMVQRHGPGGKWTKNMPKSFPKTYTPLQKALAGLFTNMGVDTASDLSQ